MKTIKDLLSEVEHIFNEEQFVFEPKELYEPIDYTLRLGGKRIRPTLLLAANQLFDGDPDLVRDAALGIETFHNFTLLHDDLMDRSPIRRGQPTVYCKWNENTAILSGDTMFALAWRYFLRKPTPNLHQILQCFDQTAIEVCEGQQYDMNFEKKALNDVSLSEYMEMIRQKTAVLLAAALKIGALYANASEEDVDKIYNFGIHLGLAFQIQDDLLDGYGDTAVFGKKTGQDIRDNKKSYLPLCALKICNQIQAQKLCTLFDYNNRIDEEEKVACTLSLYEEIGLRRHVEEAIKQQFIQAQQELDNIEANPTSKKPFQELMEMLFERKK